MLLGCRSLFLNSHKHLRQWRNRVCFEDRGGARILLFYYFKSNHLLAFRVSCQDAMSAKNLFFSNRSQCSRFNTPQDDEYEMSVRTGMGNNRCFFVLFCFLQQFMILKLGQLNKDKEKNVKKEDVFQNIQIQFMKKRMSKH